MKILYEPVAVRRAEIIFFVLSGAASRRKAIGEHPEKADRGCAKSKYFSDTAEPVMHRERR